MNDIANNAVWALKNLEGKFIVCVRACVCVCMFTTKEIKQRNDESKGQNDRMICSRS